MKKFFKGIVSACMVAACALLVTACGGPTTLYEAKFANGNDGVFGLYGTVVDNQDGTITLQNDGNATYPTSASTYFGEADKNYDWEKGGLTVSLKVKVDKTQMGAGKFAVWSLALNEKEDDNVNYLTELPAYFVGTEAGVKFVHKFTGVDTDYDALVAQEDAVLLDDGYYTVNWQFDVNADDEVTLVVSLDNNAGQEVYASQENTFNVIDSSTNTGVVTEEMVEGIRYLWLVRANADVVVDSLKITK
ncbi:MAG: hypothetical protein E7378_03955 [Clostridiales bacterium]|nr:hypothetical protein [Clostridiales bacterium]